MSITITTLNNTAAQSKAFTEVGRDRTSSEWYNSAQAADDYDGRLLIKQSIQGKNRLGVPIRRTLVQYRAKAPVTTSVGGTTTSVQEEVVINFTISSPTSLSELTSTDREDAVTFLKNFLSSTNIAKLIAGEV
jgi:hypothetical protein